MDHQLFCHQLSGGARALVICTPGAQTAAMQVYFLGGYALADKQRFEAPHVMEHLMSSANRRYPDSNFRALVEQHGAYRNAYTTQYYNSYAYQCAAFEIERMLDLLAAQLEGPLFPAASFAGEISNVHEELSRNTSNYTRVSLLALKAHFMPGSMKTDLDRIALLSNIKRRDVLRHYRQTHARANLRLVIAGDFADGGKALMYKFERRVAAMPAGQRLKIPPEPKVILTAPIVVAQPIEQIYYTLHSYLSRPLESSEEVGLDVLRRLFKGRYDSWIYGEARERGLAYELTTAFESAPVLSYLGLAGHVNPSNAQSLFEVFTRSWQRAQRGDFDDADVEAAQNYMVGLYTLAHDTPASLVKWYGEDFGLSDRATNLHDYLIAARQVTKAGIIKLANLMTTEKRWGLSLVGNINQQLADGLYETIRPIWGQP